MSSRVIPFVAMSLLASVGCSVSEPDSAELDPAAVQYHGADVLQDIQPASSFYTMWFWPQSNVEAQVRVQNRFPINGPNGLLRTATIGFQKANDFPQPELNNRKSIMVVMEGEGAFEVRDVGFGAGYCVPGGAASCSSEGCQSSFSISCAIPYEYKLDGLYKLNFEFNRGDNTYELTVADVTTDPYAGKVIAARFYFAGDSQQTIGSPVESSVSYLGECGGSNKAEFQTVIQTDGVRAASSAIGVSSVGCAAAWRIDANNGVYYTVGY